MSSASGIDLSNLTDHVRSLENPLSLTDLCTNKKKKKSSKTVIEVTEEVDVVIILRLKVMSEYEKKNSKS